MAMGHSVAILLAWVSAVFAASAEVGELPFDGFQEHSAHFNHDLFEEFLIRDSASDECFNRLNNWSFFKDEAVKG